MSRIETEKRPLFCWHFQFGSLIDFCRLVKKARSIIHRCTGWSSQNGTVKNHLINHFILDAFLYIASCLFWLQDVNFFKISRIVKHNTWRILKTRRLLGQENMANFISRPESYGLSSLDTSTGWQKLFPSYITNSQPILVF